MKIFDTTLDWIIFATMIALASAIIYFWFSSWRFGKRCFERWENGNVKNQYFVKKGKGKNGPEQFYYRDGKINKKQFWVKNKLEGISTTYYKSGEPYIVSIYKNGKLYGEQIIYSKNGLTLRKSLYKDGVEVSILEDMDSKIQEYFSVCDLKEPEPIINPYFKNSFNYEKEAYLVVRNEEETKDHDRNDSWWITKAAKTVVGVKAVQARNSSKNLKEACEKYFEEAYKTTEEGRVNLNRVVNNFGNFRLNSLKRTTGRFLGMLQDMRQQNKIKEYKILEGVGVSTQEIKKMEVIDMETSKALKSTAIVGTLGTAAAMGTPALVTGTVSALATASTGTAISTLSGVAATNATLAWLGGGSLAAGGGGMAAGAAVLSSITVGATAGVGLVAAGLIASTYYSKKLTEAKEFQKDVEIKVADMEKLWVVMDGINKRAHELTQVTSQLENRLLNQLEYLEPLTIDYDPNDNYYNMTFQKTGILAKSMSELAQSPLLDEYGNASTESAQVVEQTQKVLNKNLLNNG